MLHVDNTLLVENDIPTPEGVKAWLGKFFCMKDEEDAMYVLGIRMYREI